MVLMEMVICLHAQVSVEHSGAAAATYMMRLRGDAGEKPPGVLFLLLPERECQTREPEPDSTLGGNARLLGLGDSE